MKKLIISFRLVFSQVTLTAQKTENYIQYVNPLFRRAEDGAQLSRRDRPVRRPCRRSLLNGREVKRRHVTHAEIMSGGKSTFLMSDGPGF
jgi:hypothetical protein